MYADDVQRYKSTRIENINHCIDIVKNNFVNKKINNGKDQKQMWKEIKDLVLKKNKTMIKM